MCIYDVTQRNCVELRGKANTEEPAMVYKSNQDILCQLSQKLQDIIQSTDYFTDIDTPVGMALFSITYYYLVSIHT